MRVEEGRVDLLGDFLVFVAAVGEAGGAVVLSVGRSLQDPSLAVDTLFNLRGGPLGVPGCGSGMEKLDIRRECFGICPTHTVDNSPL